MKKAKVSIQRDLHRIAGRLLLTLAASLLWLGPSSAAAAWQLAWSDEFDGTNVDNTKWTFEFGNGSNGWGNSEREYYTSRSQNAYVTNGVLHIVARKESYGGFPYTSARMKTQGKFFQKYGRFEFRAAMPKGLGFWPALWMMGTNITSKGWPACGEIDVMEFNGSWSNKVQGTIHYSSASNNHLSQTAFHTFTGRGDSATNYHIYALEWSSNTLNWVVDGVTAKTWTTWSSSTGPYPAPYDQPFFILMNLAIGGSYLGYPSDAMINANTIFPGEMLVDYVRVYQSTDVEQARLDMQLLEGSAVLTWSNGTLLRSTNVTGPWEIVSGAASPFTNPIQPQAQEFYRVRL